MNTPGDIWKMVLSLLEKRLQPVTLDAWFDDLTAVEFKDDTLLLHTPDKFKKETEDIHIIYTNDVHGYIDNLKNKVTGIFNELQEEKRKSNPKFFLCICNKFPLFLFSLLFFSIYILHH